MKLSFFVVFAWNEVLFKCRFLAVLEPRTPSRQLPKIIRPYFIRLSHPSCRLLRLNQTDFISMHRSGRVQSILLFSNSTFFVIGLSNKSRNEIFFLKLWFLLLNKSAWIVRNTWNALIWSKHPTVGAVWANNQTNKFYAIFQGDQRGDHGLGNRKSKFEKEILLRKILQGIFSNITNTPCISSNTEISWTSHIVFDFGRVLGGRQKPEVILADRSIQPLRRSHAVVILV